MGRKDKSYSKDLHQQIYDRLTSMQAFGESKKRDKDAGMTRDKIYSFSTYLDYMKHCRYFAIYVKQNHPECTTLKSARKYTNEWLQTRVDQGLSAWTIHLEAKALSKLFDIRPGDKDYFQCPERRREDIIRSRLDVADDKHFSVSNNQELIKFCRGTGLRRGGLLWIRGKDLWDKEQIKTEISRIERIPYKNRSDEDKTMLRICRDAIPFTEKYGYFVHVKEKGGRYRMSPVVDNEKTVVTRFRNTLPDEKVWKYVHNHADVHSYRADYTRTLYKSIARDIKDIPYDRTNAGTGIRYQSDVVSCKGDLKGLKLDRKALQLCGSALGHGKHRESLVVSNYLRNL